MLQDVSARGTYYAFDSPIGSDLREGYNYLTSVGFRVLLQRLTEFVNAQEALHYRRLFDHHDVEWQKSMEQEEADSAKYSFIDMESLNPVFYLAGSALALSMFIFILEIILWAKKRKMLSFPYALPKNWL